jgi:hypothetical protein
MYQYDPCCLAPTSFQYYQGTLRRLPCYFGVAFGTSSKCGHARDGMRIGIHGWSLGWLTVVQMLFKAYEQASMFAMFCLVAAFGFICLLPAPPTSLKATDKDAEKTCFLLLAPLMARICMGLAFHIFIEQTRNHAARTGSIALGLCSYFGRRTIICLPNHDYGYGVRDLWSRYVARVSRTNLLQNDFQVPSANGNRRLFGVLATLSSGCRRQGQEQGDCSAFLSLLPCS